MAQELPLHRFHRNRSGLKFPNKAWFTSKNNVPAMVGAYSKYARACIVQHLMMITHDGVTVGPYRDQKGDAGNAGHQFNYNNILGFSGRYG